MEIPEKILCAPVKTAGPNSSTGRIAPMDETANATAIGTPASNNTTNNTKIISPEINAMLISLLLLRCLHNHKPEDEQC